MILNFHQEIDIAKEKLRGKKAIGTTGKGIGPAYSLKIDRNGHRLGELRDTQSLVLSLMNYFKTNKEYFKVLGIKIPSKEELKEELDEYAKFLEPFLADTTHLVWSELENNKRILLEGAQGTLLDIDHGTYPFVTSSNTISAGACTGLGLNPKDIGKITGIVKAYCTRVGNGPFPTEDFGEDGRLLGEKGHEFGTTTGRARRCGLMKLDVLDGFEKIKICTAYEINGKKTDKFPTNLQNVKPVYEEMDGWKKLKGISELAKLPENAKKYIKRLEELTGTKIGVISTSPDRKDTIIVKI